MKEFKNKEVIVGLVIIVILAVIAVFLLIRREMNQSNREVQVSSEESVGTDGYGENGQNRGETISITGEESGPRNEAGSEWPTAEAGVSSNGTGVSANTTSLQVKADNTDININLYSILGEENYKPATLVERKEEDDQLAELFGYWDAYKMEAVHDLLRLERIQAISTQLDGTNKFYYYGDVDQLGRPSGSGLAVYGNNTYYCGGWKEGLRSGKGMWLQIAIYDESNLKLNLGLVEHMYNGNWSKDLPNGQGQEHFQFDYAVLNQQDNKTILNVIGDFKDGYYNGEMYVMTTNNFGVTSDWSGICKKGVWDILLPGSVTDGVWRSYETDEQGDYEYHFMFPEDNVKQGIYGLKK